VLSKLIAFAPLAAIVAGAALTMSLIGAVVATLPH
jgi:hypothetical protein